MIATRGQHDADSVRCTFAGAAAASITPRYQYVWDGGLPGRSLGQGRYIDSPVLRDEDLDSDEDCTDDEPAGSERLCYANDANFNVTALVEANGAVAERTIYDAYGQPTLYNATWSAPIAESASKANEIRFCGYVYDAAVGLYTVRHRTYDPVLGRWVQRDPGAGGDRPLGTGGAPAATGRFIPRDPTGSNQYADGMNLYQYVRGNPVIYVDPQGLACCAYVRLSNTFGIPGISSIGGGHTAIELDRDGNPTLIELAAYNDGGHAAANRVGYGPLGPTMYIYYALLAQSYGLTDRDDLTKMNDLSQKYFGHPATWGIDMLDLLTRPEIVLRFIDATCIVGPWTFETHENWARRNCMNAASRQSRCSVRA